MLAGKKLSATSRTVSAGALDIDAVRADFPVLSRRVHDKRLVYLDNAASTQKPSAVIEAVHQFSEQHYSNVHRGVHRLSVEATDAFEAARQKLQRFIGARSCSEVVVTSGTTASINLVAYALGSKFDVGDEIIVTEMEHHSNIVPWQMLCERTGAILRVVPINDAGELDMAAYSELLGPRTRLVGVVHISNALGTCNPVRRMVELAHARDIPVLVDGAQAVAHERVDVQALDCDFYAFSGHKMYGPTGVGVLYGKFERLKAMPPFLGGGEMIHSVSFSGTTFKEPPHRFEAGTPPIVELVGLGAAVDYIETLGIEQIAEHEQQLLTYATRRLEAIPRVRLIGTAREKAGILSFVVDGVHPHDLGTALDLEGIAVRAGHHCAQPVMDRFGLPATTRASFAFYNDRDDVDALVEALPRIIEVLG